MKSFIILVTAFSASLGWAQATTQQNCGDQLAAYLALDKKITEPTVLKAKSGKNCDVTISALSKNPDTGDTVVSLKFDGKFEVRIQAFPQITETAYWDIKCGMESGDFVAATKAHVRAGWLGQEISLVKAQVKDGKIQSIIAGFYSGGPFTDQRTTERSCQF